MKAIVAYLLTNGADKYRHDNLGNRSVDDAKRNKHVDIVKMLEDEN
jgi:ankyrin repeat protein